MTDYQYGAKLVQAVLDVLARPDWQLHFPNFPTVPFMDTKGKQKQGSHDQGTYLLDESTRRIEIEENLFKQGGVARVPDHQKDIAYLREHSPLPGEMGAKTDSQGRIDFEDVPRIHIVGVQKREIRSADALSECILAPLQNAITQPEGETARDTAEFENAVQAELDKDTPLGKAVYSIIRRVALSPAGELVWRPTYFRYSLSELKLQSCGLQSECLRPLGDFLVQNPNLVDLDLFDNRCLVSMPVHLGLSVRLLIKTALTE